MATRILGYTDENTDKVLAPSEVKTLLSLSTVASSGSYTDLLNQPAIVPPTRLIIPGVGLTGGGDLAANRTVGLDSASQISLQSADTAVQPSDLEDYQPLADNLTAIAANPAPIANQSLYWTAPGTTSTYTLTDSGRALVGLTGAANAVPYWTGTAAASTFNTTASGRAFMANAGTSGTAPYLSAANTWSLQTVSASGRNLWNIGGTIDNMAYLSAANTWSLVTTTSYGRSLLATTDSAWITATMGNSWVAYGNGFPGLQYRKIGNVVHLRGAIKSGSITNGVLLATLPSGYRPTVPRWYVCAGGDMAGNGTAVFYVGITAGGLINLYGIGFNTFLSLDNIPPFTVD